MKYLWRSGKAKFALITLAAVVATAIVSLFWTPHDPNFAPGGSVSWLSPSLSHPLGTDASGRDLASRLIAGSQVTVIVALGTGLFAGAIGVVLGALQNLGVRAIREPLAILIDVLIAFPTLLLAIMLTAVFNGGITIVIVSVGVGFGVQIARVVRAEMRQILKQDYIVAAKASGVSSMGLLFRHILPNISPVLTVQLSLSMGLAILAESGLSYLGFGAPHGTPSWGRMLAETQGYISVHPEVVLWPGLTITVTVLAFYLLGDALRESFSVGKPKETVVRRTQLGVQA